MQNELYSIHKNGSWDLMPLPKGKKVLPCKQVYKYKYTSNSAHPNYKARITEKVLKKNEESISMRSSLQ